MPLAEFILDNMETILQEWEKFAQSTPQGARMDPKALRDEAEQILRQVAKDMSRPETAEQQEDKSKSRAGGVSSGKADNVAASHASVRHREGFDLNEMVAEYRALRASVIRLWTEQVDGADAETLYELTRFNEAIDESWVEAIARYSDELSRSRELLLGILGHDLRTPLGAVLMSARVMLDYGDLDERNAKAAGRVFNSAKHMEEMLSALLDVTRMRLGGSLPMECAPTDLSAICRRVVDEVRAVHPKRQIDLDLNGDLRGDWDSSRLVQMTSNLLTNAIQHGAADRPVSLSAGDAGEVVVLRVHNAGEPIPDAAMQRIFKPMVQTAPDQTKPKGLGLGLYIVRAIAEAHGGKIQVDSSKSQGTTFTVHLPRRCAD